MTLKHFDFADVAHYTSSKVNRTFLLGQLNRPAEILQGILPASLVAIDQAQLGEDSRLLVPVVSEGEELLARAQVGFGRSILLQNIVKDAPIAQREALAKTIAESFPDSITALVPETRAFIIALQLRENCTGVKDPPTDRLVKRLLLKQVLKRPLCRLEAIAQTLA